MAAFHVVPDLGDHALLCSGEGEGKCLVASVECISHLRHHNAVVRPATDIFLLQQRKLKIKQFLEFETIFSLFQRSCVLWEMDISYRVMQGHKSALLHYIFRQTLLEISQRLAQSGVNQFVHHLSGDASVLQLLSTWIHASHPCSCGGHLEFLCSYGIYFRMHNVDLASEH